MSSNRLQTLLEERANIWSQMTEVIDEAEKAGRDLSAEERQKYEAAEKDLEAKTKAIDTLQRHADHARSMEQVERDPIVNGGGEVVVEGGGEAEAYRTAFRSYLRYGMEELSTEQKQILRKGFVDSKELRAQGVGTNSAGGYLVPAGFRDNLIRTMKAYGSVLDVATFIETDSGNTLPWPTVDDTSQVGVILAENTQLSEQDATLGTANLDAYVITSKLTRMSLQLIQDSAIDPEDLVVSLHGERIGRGMNVYLTTGTGSSQPDGIVTNAATGVTAAGAAAITSDELIDLEHSVDPAYRENGKFMLADATLANIRKLKASGTGEYLWQPSMQAGAPSLLNGRPYVINQQMPAATTGNKSVLFGDFRAGYVVRLVRQIQNIRFNERYMDYLQVGFTSFARFDGTQQNAAAYKALVQA